ncbi:anaerobic glycerol-3-phosphate dehydrogenase subunit GlpB [Desulfosporosinus meridiei]|uniref:Glycerol 3-phosphate dehydrogenase (Quinone) subunit B n=1 Tax=Desulfosporosinus meridiei (strain ATCC BAA-275 / DSM 13257 / KCTC 12902 / NCIMB 13706 / S10) TaxID=768704 RepID=J7J4Y3_DESMD|nr:anaerobic glycerol-3-phosphate dehydrogenase subunit GlpB [Desulfosporosinus meridiei]AFQ46308.1 glycerol 3-phosphate dehydrogenase (quinone) subunit B [Desulfosporosinus meridiei DSM 13257]
MWDGIIIGGGLAGLLAGIRAAERGKKVLIVSEGVGSLTYSSGVIDLGDVERLMNQKSHPYALLGEKVVRSAAEYFQTLFPDYSGNWREPQFVLTPLGTPRKAGLIPRGLNTQALTETHKIILMALEGMKDFFPEVARSNLLKAYPQAEVVLHPFRVEGFEAWYTLGKSITGMDCGKYWRTASGIETLKGVWKSLDSFEPDKAVVIFPGLTSVFSQLLREVQFNLPFSVIEMTAFPPSAGGHYLYRGLVEKFKALGGELLVGSGVKKVELKGKQCHKIIVNSKGKDSEFSARVFVLATGGIFGGGIEVTLEAAKEMVFGLPPFVPSGWTNSEFLGEQPYARMGVETDNQLRPIDFASKEVLLENVRVIGRMLAHWDPWVEHCGGGVSLASGWFAGEQI